MKKTIIIETNGYKYNYVEGDIVLIKPVSKKIYEQRVLDRDGPGQSVGHYDSCYYPQSTFIDKWNDMYGDKYLLGIIQSIANTYQGKRTAHIDFIYFKSNGSFGIYRPFGYGYSFFDSLRVDIIKCLDYIKYSEGINKLIASKERVGIPTTKIVYRKGSNIRRADMSSYNENSIISRLEYKRKEKSNKECMITPEEVVEYNTQPPHTMTISHMYGDCCTTETINVLY